MVHWHLGQTLVDGGNAGDLQRAADEFGGQTSNDLTHGIKGLVDEGVL